MKERIESVMDTNDNDLEFPVTEDARTLLPDATYEVAFVRQERRPYHGGTKLYVHFQITSLGPHFGKPLVRAYNFYCPPTRGSDLYKDLERLYGRRTSKGMKLSTGLFRNKVLKVQTRTVKKDRKQTALPEHQLYSVVDKILGIVAGSTEAGS